MRLRFFIPVIIFFLLGNSCSHKALVKSTELSHQYLATAPVDSASYKILQPYKEKLDKEMNEVVSYCDEALNKDVPEGALGNFVSDCLFLKAKEYLGAEGNKVDAVLINNGGLRVSLPQGEITKGKIFELMPFDNELVLVELSGKKFYEMLVFISEKGGMPVSGIRMEINAKKNL
jgi:2',3'-cyclic-nucleotide 2'-phosphodiesterase (5'-nucleotidase family)